jgi:hypothetical protein
VTTTQIIVLIAVLAVVAALAVRRSAPSVTQIDRVRTHREKEIEDRDDA